jgi:hypothetical protein
VLPEKEEKLLRLALDRAAAPGEIQNCAIKLIESWRKRKATVEDFTDAPAANHRSNGASAKKETDYGEIIMHFGKHKGNCLCDIPRSYLSWLLGWMRETPEKAEKFKDLIKQVEAFLRQ